MLMLFLLIHSSFITLLCFIFSCLIHAIRNTLFSMANYIKLAFQSFGIKMTNLSNFFVGILFLMLDVVFPLKIQTWDVCLASIIFIFILMFTIHVPTIVLMANFILFMLALMVKESMFHSIIWLNVYIFQFIPLYSNVTVIINTHGTQ